MIAPSILLSIRDWLARFVARNVGKTFPPFLEKCSIEEMSRYRIARQIEYEALNSPHRRHRNR